MMQSLLDYAQKLNEVKLRLARKDLHLTTMLYNPALGAITAVLDSEFSGVVPFIKWNPHSAFLSARDDDANSAGEKQKCLDLFRSRCADKGVQIVENTAYASPLQESMQTVPDFLRAIIEVAPRDQRKDTV
ncbi:hypothetical protein F4678DRAFT_315718 [Xylaria arbuscula]|nr:hypothetical protein F4678DRAFT_315718 [Xylaria arbuscula]